MDALVLAGGKEKPYGLELTTDAAYPIEGRSMLAHVIDAVAGTGKFRRIVVVGDQEATAEKIPGVIWLTPELSLSDNLKKGLEATEDADYVLVTSADIPLVTPDAITKFLAQCADSNGDIYYPIIAREVFANTSLAAQRTFLMLRDGEFTGGNMALVRPQAILNRMTLVQKVLEMRKNPVYWGKLLGWPFFVKALTAGVSIKEIERRVKRRFGLTGVAIVSDSLGIGLDADSEEDLGWIRFYWGVEKEGCTAGNYERLKALLTELEAHLRNGEIRSARVEVELLPNGLGGIHVKTEPTS
ncbi:MAG TPA: NTP transferase domain-containing protein [Firmicutes bacterium]|jgi:2-phospho-L-lactate guanylyltransferase (CobY/MobA/RfbA family)|nr:NTP transferase domain-containing protein [Bacillota bacterium]HOQ23232.1 NTP transferase domain-containing protein [Bacillota bacterium]HPT66661.1 NTP transferase domain-containing protein [Bacillota bacterium]